MNKEKEIEGGSIKMKRAYRINDPIVIRDGIDYNGNSLTYTDRLLTFIDKIKIKPIDEASIIIDMRLLLFNL